LKDPVTWVKPEVVCQIRFLDWTNDGMLRAPVFVALRDDKPAEEVVREVTPPTPALDFSSKEATLTVDGHSLKFTNLDKVFFRKMVGRNATCFRSMTRWPISWCPTYKDVRSP
jgi:bifunctional non-homologous end joining protein LigD